MILLQVDATGLMFLDSVLEGLGQPDALQHSLRQGLLLYLVEQLLLAVTGLVLLTVCRRAVLLGRLRSLQMALTTVRLVRCLRLGAAELCQFLIQEHALELTKETQVCREETLLVVA